MSELPPSIAVAVAALLALGAIPLLFRSGPEKQLRQRAETLGLGRNLDRGLESAGPSIRATARDEQPRMVRLLGLLGYDPEIPAAYRPSWLKVAAFGLIAALLVGTQGRVLFGATLAPFAGLAAGLLVMRFLFQRAKRKYADLLFVQIPDAISLVLRAVRAGLPVSEAIRNIGQETPSPTCDEFNRIAHETAIGMPVETAIWRLFQRSGIKEYAFLSVTIGLQAQTGGNLAETLENLADLVRKRVAMQGKVRALSSEGRASATILVLLPFVVIAALGVIAPDYAGDLFTHPRSPGFLATFAVLMTIGILTMRWMIQKSTTD
jgi:tight adherence protein B